MTTEISITEDDIRAALQQKVNQVTNLELQLATLGRVLGEIFVSPEYVGDHINECIANPDSPIDLSSDGWVSVNDILIEEGHAYDYHGGKKKDFKKEIKEEKKAAEESAKEI